MSRYIDANAYIKYCEEHWIPLNFDAINSQPTADVVAVVRCRDCKFYQDNNGGYPNQECKWIDGETPNADDFCSFAERMTE